MNRRQAIVGLGGLVAGGGAVVGTGAFSQVEAQRGVTVETTGDAGANLGITPASEGSEYVNAPDGGVVEIDFNDVNQNAITSVDRLLKITNNGNQSIAVGFDNQYAVDDSADYNTVPGPWGYAGINTGNNEAIVVVLWASLTPDQDDRPTLTTTGFKGSTPVDNRYSYDYEDVTDRQVGAGNNIYIGARVDTRTKTINDSYPLPSPIDSSVDIFAES
jgi:hypothetical protein